MDKKYKRPTWDEYFMAITDQVGKRSTCDRGRAGTIIVKDNQIVSSGYAGSPSGAAHCDDIGHDMQLAVNPDGSQSNHCVRTTHSEQNAIALAAKRGLSTNKSTIYTRMMPCLNCAKIIVNAGIVRVVCQQDYHASARTKSIFKECGIDYEIIDKAVVEYPMQKANQ